MKQPGHNPPLPDIADDLETAIDDLQSRLDAAGVRHFKATAFGKLTRKNWTGPRQQLPCDTTPIVTWCMCMDVVRDEMDIPIETGSTFRPYAYNTADGQSSKSQHLWARAGDPRPSRSHNTPAMRRRLYDTIKRLLPRLRKIVADAHGVDVRSVHFGLKIYSGFVHFDVSIDGQPGARVRDWLPAPCF